MRLSQYGHYRRVADYHRHAQAPGRGQKAAITPLLDHHHALFIFQQVFNDAEADVTQPTYHDVSGVGDAADFQGAAQARPQEIIGNYGRENGRQGGAYDAEAADKHFLPATLRLVHVRARGDHAHRPVQAVAYTLIRSENPQVINQRARDHDA